LNVKHWLWHVVCLGWHVDI